MDVDSKSLICGIRPAVLKSLLRKEWFDTPMAMKLFALSEPQITETLAALERDGWIAFKGADSNVDQWVPAEKGMRLTATRLLKRIPHSEGRKILEALIDEARAINADDKASRRVKSIRVFGSVLTGQETGTVGDVDVVVDVGRRELPKPILAAIERAENADKPRSLSFVESLCWLSRRVDRRLAAVSRYLSFHPESDLSAKRSPFRQVYAFDVKRERETKPDPAIKVLESTDETSSIAETASHRAPRSPRPWPSLPPKSVFVEIGMDEALLAQHLWMNGVDLKGIAAQVHASIPSVRGYLSSRAFRGNSVEPRKSVSLRSMLLDVLPGSREYTVRVFASMPPSDEVLIDLELETLRGRTVGSLRRVGREFQIFKCKPELVPTLEQLDAAAYAWSQHIEGKLHGLGAQVSAHCYPDAICTEPCQSSVMKLSALAECLRDLLDRLWTEPRHHYDRRERRVAMALSEKPTLTFDVGLNRRQSRAIRGKSAAPAIEALRNMNQHFRRSIAAEHWLVYFRGDVLVRARELKNAAPS